MFSCHLLIHFSYAFRLLKFASERNQRNISLQMNNYFKFFVSVIALSAFSIGSCKKEDPAKTNQDCMNESGAAYYANADGVCTYAGALSVNSAANHWNQGAYQMQFIRNGSNTGGTGKMIFNNGAVSTFSWEMDAHNTGTIIISGYDNVYTSTEQISQITEVAPNQQTNPTTFTSRVTYSNGTFSATWNLAAGAL